MAAVITDLYFYPIKGFRGFRTKELALRKDGPELDRQWMLIDDKKNGLTLDQLPSMSRVGVKIEDFIELAVEGFDSVDFGLGESEGADFKAHLGEEAVTVREVSSEVSEWLSQVLSREVKLVRLDHPSPILLISKASLQDLETRSRATFSLSRFRPTIVVDGVPAYAEDTWPRFKLGPIEFQALHAGFDLQEALIHPLTGEKGQEPLHTLSAHHKVDGKPAFGFYFKHSGPGRIHIGQELSF